MRFLIDNNLSPKLAEGMRAFGENVEHLTDHFPPDAADTQWLSYVGEKRMCVITRDERIRWRPAELLALKQHNVGAFFLGGKERTHCDLVQQLVRNWPRIKEHAHKTRRPFAFKVRPRGAKIDAISLP